ncbi:MAG TPA: DUF3300 domain-containing protein [Gammaproteobacteria bacterium]
MHRARTRILDPIRTAASRLLAAAALALAGAAGAQDADDTRLFTADELEELVAPIALYPDDLVAIVLPAATYPVDVVEAARFLDELEDDPGLAPDGDWDDSIVALLNYPDVLRLMDEDLDWTWDLGEAFLNQQAEVFDAIQRFRAQAREAGNLVSDEHVVVSENDGAVRIVPADPEVIYVPYYEPREVIVHHHHAPIRYYPRPCPVYYYPYPAGYSFWSGYFWGVTTAFVIGWHTHHLNVHHPSHVGHPYHLHHYHDPFYVRRSISINVVNVDRDVYVWQPRHHRIGGRPGRVTVTREGPVRPDYGSHRYVARGDEGRRTVTAERRATASGGRTIGATASTERRAAAGAEGSRASVRSTSERGAAAAGATRSAASESRLASPSRRTATSARDGASAGGRVTTREGIVRALRDAGERRPASGSAAASNRTIGGIARSAEPADARGTASADRAASSPSRGAVSPSRSTTSPSRNVTSPTRSGVSPSRSTASPSRNAVRSSSSTTSSTIGAVSTSRSATPRSSSGATRGSAGPTRSGASTGTSRGASAGTSRGASASVRSSGRSAATRSAHVTTARSSTGRTRTSR